MPGKSLGWSRTGNATETSTLLPVHKNTKIDQEIASENEKVVEKRPKLGTFEGVFLPTALNELSILMFLRFGFIIGQMGITGTFLLLIMSYTIDILTVMSISAISTNGTVKGGGAYYMISRSLGPEFGGAIGVIFCIGQILNASLNVVGLIEPILVNFGEHNGDILQILPIGYFWQALYCSIVLACCTGVALVGAKLVSKTAFYLFIILSLSTLSIPISALFVKPFNPLPPPHQNLAYTGLSWATVKENMWPHFTSGAAGSVLAPGEKETFKNLFGIFFPSTAGIFAGASMSGELANPSKSIPQGTLKGLLLTFIFYSLVIASLGSTISRELFYQDIKVIQTVNMHKVVVLLGEISTSLFSAIMGIVGAATMLSAIADDKIIPGLSAFTVSKKSSKERKLGESLSVLATWCVAQIFLFADINQIATFITMAFLMTFIVTNLACFLLRVGSAPNFRPSFKYFSSRTALTGCLTSIFAMFIVDGISASLIIVFLMLLIIIIHYLTPPLKFGDISQLLIYHQVRKYLLRLKLQMSVKYWRPQILLLCDDPRTSWNLIGFCNHLKKGGLYILGHVVVLNDEANPENNSLEFGVNSYKEIQKQRNAWLKLRDMSNIKAFVQIALGPTLPWGVRNVYLGSGLGGMRPNITVLGFYDFVKHGVELPFLSSFKDKNKITELPTDDCRKERKVSIGQWVQIVEDLIIMQATVAVAANFGAMNLPQPEVKRQHFWSQPKPSNSDVKKYIDLYPIQMSSISHLENGKSVLSTNFDTYTLILQLGAILVTVPEWKYSLYSLRVIVFVENQFEVNDEKKRVSELLSTLRIEAEVKIICLDDGTLNSYNLLVKGYSKTSGNKKIFDRLDRTLKHDQWWKNLCNARHTLKELEKQKVRKQAKKTQSGIDEALKNITSLDLNHPSSRVIPSNLSTNEFKNNRRYTISNLQDRGLSLSFNMKTQQQDFFAFEDSSSSDSSDNEREDISCNIEDSLDSSRILDRITSHSPNIDDNHESSNKNNQDVAENAQLKTLTKLKEYDDLRSGRNVSTDRLSIKSSRSSLRPNFLSVKFPKAKFDDEDHEADGDNPSIRFVIDDDSDIEDENDNEEAKEEATEKGKKHMFTKVTSSMDRERGISHVSRLDQKGKKGSKKADIINTLKSKGILEEPPKSPSFMTNDDDIIRRMNSPEFLTVEDGEEANKEKIPSEGLSYLPKNALSGYEDGTGVLKANDSAHQSAEAHEGKGLTQRQLQEELKNLSFNDLPAKGQHLILNELMRSNSPLDQTDVIFSTLPAPFIGTHLDEEDSFIYTHNLAIWTDGLPPTLLINSQTVTVTTAL
ncbi:uncharacterized protein AC631_02391 [Debaryomyces fabryi]|uniref:Amino acid permease/ SLC12A domain-containing protein n=1 Tax=Debaryomyces fabryi TaxID=58627 RepID=A0A0V1Q0B7_9ASCO|nr:uncharacterized protein AC631_02391 [Debaryomyces fabryi]KSA01858.1 hypothetical protein AC631_02391 [Debaryomyces fabryi]CUM45614.1 unnamed protein product [Debaryomyces fabryi]